MYGVDYAFSPHPTIAALQAAGAKFAVRYISNNPKNDLNGKNLLPAEAKALRAAGLRIAVVVEYYARRMLGGHAQGVTDAAHADAVVTALGMPRIPVYFAADWDATPAEQADINAYLDGAASVIGRARVGIYGGYYPVKRALDAGKAAYAWQTSAWSGGQWDSRAAIRQYGARRIGDATCDSDNSMRADFGQWPRPAPPRPAPHPTVATRMVADGKLSLRQAAAKYGMTELAIWWLTAQRQPEPGPAHKSYFAALNWKAAMPAGMNYWVLV